MSYADIRATLRPGGFFVSNLWHLTRISYALGKSGEVRYPAIPLTIASIAERVAARWEGEALDNDVAQRVEDAILPKLQALVELADANDGTVVDAAINDALITMTWRCPEGSEWPDALNELRSLKVLKPHAATKAR